MKSSFCSTAATKVLGVTSCCRGNDKPSLAWQGFWIMQSNWPSFGLIAISAGCGIMATMSKGFGRVAAWGNSLEIIYLIYSSLWFPFEMRKSSEIQGSLQIVFLEKSTNFLQSGEYAGFVPSTFDLLLFKAEILHQLIGSLSHYSQGFVHPRWCRISFINS